MKLGFGLYRNSLNTDNYKFVNQIGATHVVAHLTNYFSGSNPEISSAASWQSQMKWPSRNTGRQTPSKTTSCWFYDLVVLTLHSPWNRSLQLEPDCCSIFNAFQPEFSTPP